MNTPGRYIIRFVAEENDFHVVLFADGYIIDEKRLKEGIMDIPYP